MTTTGAKKKLAISFAWNSTMNCTSATSRNANAAGTRASRMMAARLTASFSASLAPGRHSGT